MPEKWELMTPWLWVDDDAECRGTRGHDPDWYLVDAEGKCILWASHDGNCNDTRLRANPGVLEFIQKACNSYEDLVAENARLREAIEQLRQAQRLRCCE